MTEMLLRFALQVPRWAPGRPVFVTVREGECTRDELRPASCTTIAAVDDAIMKPI